MSVSTDELADVSTANLQRSRRLNILLLCTGAFMSAGVLVTLLPLAVRSLPSSTNFALFYSGLLVVLLGGGVMFAIERYRLKRLMRDDSGAAVGSAAVFHDLAHEAEFDRMKNALVSVASHELRTPLNAILGYTEMLQEGACGPLLSEQRSAIARIVSNIGQLLLLANNLLDHAQLEVGALTLNAISFSPAELVDSVRGVMDMLARAKNLKLTGHIASDVPATLWGDRQRLHQILVNLVGNAIQFTDEGMVHMRVYRPDAVHWALAVSDTGRGIPEELLRHVFEGPAQTDNPLKRDYSGGGLGLSVVKRLVALMGGEIVVESESGKGSTFIVTLPLIEQSAAKEGMP